MCTECGCSGKDGHRHVRGDGTVYFHANHDDHDGEGHGHGELVAMEANILAENDRYAEETREFLLERGIFAVNLISSPGSGKTALLERTLSELNGRIECAVVVGDQRGDADAKRLEGRGAPVVQIETGDACHLDARQVKEAICSIITPGTRLVFIENVGNLVCPAAFDLGEAIKVAVLSAPEGEDKPLKYPTLFNRAAAVVLSKLDLCPYLEWDIVKCREYLHRVNPAAELFELSSRSGAGFEPWLNFLLSRCVKR